MRVDDGKPLGRVDVAMLPGGDAVVVWLESTSSRAAEIRARRVRRDGQPGASFVVAPTSEKRSSGFPHVVRAGDALYFAWTDEGDPPDRPSQVRLAALDLPRSWR